MLLTTVAVLAMFQVCAAASPVAPVACDGASDYVGGSGPGFVPDMTLSESPAAAGDSVCADPSVSYVPRPFRLISATLSWGDGSKVTLPTVRRPVEHVYVRPGRFRIRLTLVVAYRRDRRRQRFRASTATELLVKARKRIVLPAGAGLSLVNLDDFGDPYRDQGTVWGQLSADGNHLVWEWGVKAAADYYAHGFVWRDLHTGQTIEQPSLDPFAFGISGDGTYVAYATVASTEPDGLVTGMKIWLWNVQTGRRIAISRTPAGKLADDGITYNIAVSGDGRYVVFDSTSPTLAPSDVTVCRLCIEGGQYVYLFDRVTGTLTPVPPTPLLDTEPPGPVPPPPDQPPSNELSVAAPVISGDGSVVAFHVGSETAVWYPRAAAVRRLADTDFPCGVDDDSLALSADGTTLANNCGGAVGVVKLGGPTGPDTVQWTHTFSAQQGYSNSVALSAGGSVMALIGPEGPAGWGLWPVYRVALPAGTVTTMPAPAISGLRPEPGVQEGMAGDTVTVSADGSAILASGCSLQAPSSTTQSCPERTDLYRWTQ